jgi:hypothetical protein
MNKAVNFAVKLTPKPHMSINIHAKSEDQFETLIEKYDNLYGKGNLIEGTGYSCIKYEFGSYDAITVFKPHLG